MKDVLIVLSASSGAGLDTCQVVQKAAMKFGVETRSIHNTAILLTGPKSLENLLELSSEMKKLGATFSVFEIESVLTPSVLAPNT